ncbi:MAG TPA: hypothetical protein VK895_05270 [Jiangellaceae bacterium]|nr:hypothetical protein [Jiangellaceae bacterium]
MTALISAELLKIRTTRLPAVTIAVVLLIAAALPVLYAAAAGSGDIEALNPASLTDMMGLPAKVAGGGVLLIGLLLAAGEFRHRTVFTTRLAEPRPQRVLAAKLVAMTVTGLAVGVVLDLVTAGVGGAVLAYHGEAFEPFARGFLGVALVVPLVLALHGVLGVAVGTLLRSTTAAVGVTLMWAFVVEGIVPVVFRTPEMATWLPRGAIQNLLSAQTTTQLPLVTAGALIVGYAAALVAAAALADGRREL